MKQIQYIFHLVKFALSNNKLLYLSIGLALFSVLIELLAMSSLLPLFELVSGKSTAQGGMVNKVLEMFNLSMQLNVLLWCFIVLFTIRIITLVISQTLVLYLGKRVQAQLGSQAFEKIMQNISLTEINQNSIGFYTSLAGDEASRASNLIINLTQFISSASLSALYFFAIYQYSTNTALMIVIFIFLCGVVLLQIMKISHHFGSLQVEQSRTAGSAFIDGINNLKTIRSFNAENYVANVYKNKIYGYTKTLFVVEEIAILTKFIPVLLLICCLALWYFFSADSVEEVGIAFIVTMIVYLMRFFPTVGQGVNLMLRIVSDAKSGKDITAVISARESDEDKKAQAMLNENIKAITLDKVQFSYPNSEIKTLNEVSYQFFTGESYALVGPSGTGKSTLIDLILKFLTPTSGTIYINQQQSSEINSAKLRNKLLLVSQEPAIFDDTVFNNICMGIKANLDQVKTACQLACIDDVIENMESGYQTRLQYQGKNISGGQRQRIAIARALLRSPDVLILDESTSALDKAIQEEVIGNILQAFKNKIVIFVTHDPMIANRVSYKFDLSIHNA